MQKFCLFLLALITFGSTTLRSQTLDSLPSRLYSWDLLTAGKAKAGNTLIPVLKGSTWSLSQFDVSIAFLAGGQVSNVSKSFSGKEQLIIVRDGELNINIKGNVKTLSRGGIALFMPGDEHSITNAGKSSATFYVLNYHSKENSDPVRGKNNGGSIMLAWNEVPFKPHDKGGRKDFFNRPTSQLKKFEMHTTALNAGLDSHAPHIHTEEEIILLLKGNVKMHIDGKLYPAAPGDVVFLSAGIPHALLNTGSEQAEYFAFQWRN